MYAMTEITGVEKEIIKLYNFFDSLGNSVMPNKKRYMFYNKIGKAYAIYKNNKIIGGLSMYPEKGYDVILNFYIPEDSRKGMQSLRMLQLVMEYNDGKRPVLFRAEDVTDYRGMAKVMDEENMIYQLNIPEGLR